MQEISIETEFINLMQLLKWANVVSSGAEVKALVNEGLIRVNNNIETRYRRKLYDGDIVDVDDQIKLVITVNEHNKNSML